MSDDDFAENFNKAKQAETGDDSNKDGIVDGSPESVKKLGEDIGRSLAGFFQGLLGGFAKGAEEELKKEEANTSGPQVLNEDK